MGFFGHLLLIDVALSIESKLLKPSKTYVLGRKERPLVVNHKSISRDHVSFTVGDYTEEDVVCA